MISFSKLGNYGRLGNQLFQYAFLRTQAERLKTEFYCPEWIGDTIFDLHDRNERATESKTSFTYLEKESGYHADVNEIKDGTEISGFFQSDKFFSKDNALKWFLFRGEIFSDLRKKYHSIDFSNSTAIHIRLGDYASPQLTFYTPRKFYFKDALKKLNEKDSILVFSDDPNGARKYLKNIPGSFIFIEGNKDYEDLYLMSRCKNIICSPSSFSWWAAYLDACEDKKVIVPEYWFLPGAQAVNNNIFVDGWIPVPAHAWYDWYLIKFIPHTIEVYWRRVGKAIRLVKKGGFGLLFGELKKFFTANSK